MVLMYPDALAQLEEQYSGETFNIYNTYNKSCFKKCNTFSFMKNDFFFGSFFLSGCV